jgi:anti-sigma regulatory factor (Ser/Thr protein kinase)
MTAAILTMSAHTPADIRIARATLLRELHGWECGNVPDAVLVFSELVTNAVLHAGGALAVRIVHGDQTLRVEVRDAAPNAPERRPPPQGRPGGFGLNIVTTLARSWGWEPTADGKVVWADIPCCPDGD